MGFHRGVHARDGAPDYLFRSDRPRSPSATYAWRAYWGLLLIIPGVVVLILRILDEEKMLTQELGGYREYKQRVHYRLVPYVW